MQMRTSVLYLPLILFSFLQSALSLEKGFADPPKQYHPWCYYLTFNGHTDKGSIEKDFAAMNDLGFSGVLFNDSRGYHDNDDNHLIMPGPKNEWMGDEWLDNLVCMLDQARKYGMEFTMNVSSHGGSLRSAWKSGEDAPKKLLFKLDPIPAGCPFHETLEIPDIEHFNDIAFYAINYEGDLSDVQGRWLNAGGGPGNNATGHSVGGSESLYAKALKVVELTPVDGCVRFDTGEGKWAFVRFGYSTIPEYDNDIDVLDPEAVTRYLTRFISTMKSRIGDHFGTTLTHFYSVSWEGVIPTWTKSFEKDFIRFAGYDIRPFLPYLAGFRIGTEDDLNRFMTDFSRARNDMFRVNFYETMRDITHSCGMKMYSESGGPWNRKQGYHLEADQLEYLSVNDMPQGEFWYKHNFINDARSPVMYLRGVSSAAHAYGKPRVSAEAFTHMTYHWAIYPFLLKGIGDDAFIDGINHFVWHTYTCSPDSCGVPGIEYYAGTHINRKVTWHKEAKPFVDYLSRCQFLLQQGVHVSDLAVWGGDEVYQDHGHYRTHPYDGSNMNLPKGYPYDLVNTDVLINRMSVEKGRIVLPDGMSYGALVLDPASQASMTREVRDKLACLERKGAVIIEQCTDPRIPFLPDTDGPFDSVHRRMGDIDIFFVKGEGHGEMTFRTEARSFQLWDAVSGIRTAAEYERTEDNRTKVTLDLPENGSVFVVFNINDIPQSRPLYGSKLDIDGPWTVSFEYMDGIDTPAPTPRQWDELHDLTLDRDPEVRYFSGSVTYKTSFIKPSGCHEASLSLGTVDGGLAHVYVNGCDCGTIWTDPWSVDISRALKEGENDMEVVFTNCWTNRMVGDTRVPASQRVCTTNMHYWKGPRVYGEDPLRPVRNRMLFPTVYSGFSDTDPLMNCGLYGPVIIMY